MAKQRKGIEKLVRKGKNQGFLTQEEILEAFPDAEKRIEAIRSEVEKVLDKLGQMEIET